jgi:hypothetical protein
MIWLKGLSLLCSFCNPAEKLAENAGVDSHSTRWKVFEAFLLVYLDPREYRVLGKGKDLW